MTKRFIAPKAPRWALRGQGKSPLSELTAFCHAVIYKMLLGKSLLLGRWHIDG
jgi:hypothetical protein